MRMLIAVAVLRCACRRRLRRKTRQKNREQKNPSTQVRMQRFAKQGLQAYDATRKCAAIQRRS